MNDFVEALVNVIEPKYVQTIKTSHKLMSLAHKSKVINIPKEFYENTKPFKDKIFSNDEKFFLDLNKEKKSIVGTFQFDKIWHTMLPENKEKTFMYFKVLFVLSEKYMEYHNNNKCTDLSESEFSDNNKNEEKSNKTN